MSELESRVREHLKLNIPNQHGVLPQMPSRWYPILRHYEARIAKGMKLAYAVDQALANLSGSNRHDAIRRERTESEVGYDNV